MGLIVHLAVDHIRARGDKGRGGLRGREGDILLDSEAELFLPGEVIAGRHVIGLYPQIRALSAARWGPYTEEKSLFTPAGKPAGCNECAAGGPCACMDSIAVADVFGEARRRVLAHAEPA